ncbi:ATP-binding protein [Bacillus cereus]|nr:ATP-binding protein [Bacillus cereus]MEB8992812.1 ATP-binding protein [Bacillus cereus]MEB9183948.1 ATP-binding protein [Bacillus cereus]
MIYLDKLSEITIDLENNSFKKKPIAFEKQTGFPYHDLQPRDFERLVYSLFRKEIINNKIDGCDEIQLMQGVGERGRDCLLLKEGEPVGVIQCKRYKGNIDISEVGKEITKFILHYTQDNSLISDINNFTYKLAVSSGFSEKALNFLNSLSSNTYNIDEIEGWAKDIINKTVALKYVVFNDIKDTLINCLNNIKFKKLLPEDLNSMLENHVEIKRMFFELRSIIDVQSFEKLLLEREKEKIDLIHKSSYLERVLEEKNKYLYTKLQDTKKIVQNLIDEFCTNFNLYTYHNKAHTINLTDVIGNKLLDEFSLTSLNEKELYVLSVASYLHDIGICITNDEIEELYQEYLANNTSYRELDIHEYIRKQHPYLTFNFISTKWELLGLEEGLKEAIALVAGENREINVFDSKYFEYASDGGRYKVCIPYLYAHLKLADMIDIENINANYLLRNYEEMEEYKLSKKLWEEADFSINTTIKNEDRLVFCGKCDDQLLFISINRHIEELKRLYEKLISEIRKFRHDARFSISFIEEDIETALSKKMGFSIDYAGISNMLIGENIYSKNYDALREVIQNSIDSCSIKKTKYESYEPVIIVELTGTSLIIKDNGLGMDEYIIENYFSKLCKSYYKDCGLDAIGQFGIGVFSYFMICDSFTVETRVKDENIIKFKAYKNLYSYFYFFEESNSQLEEGTIISMHLKDNIYKDLDFNKLITMIRDYFKFVDIPIKVINGDNQELVEKGTFTLNVEEELKNLIELKHQYKMNDLIFLETYIEEKSYEGIVGLIFNKSENNILTPFDLSSILNRYSIHSNGTRLICQKGVKITNASSTREIGGRLFENLIYKLNLKMNLSLNLGRDNFRDTKFDEIIHQFEIDLLSKFFETIHELSPENSFILNAQFVACYIDVYWFPYNDLNKFILNNFYVEVFNKGTWDHFILSNFLNENEHFILVGGEHWEEEKLESLYRKFEIPIVHIANYDFLSFYFKYFSELDYLFTLVEQNFLLISAKEKQKKFKVDYKISIPFDNNLLFTTIKSLKYNETFYNSNHPLIQLYLENKSKIVKDLTLSNHFTQFFKYIRDFTHYSNNQMSLKQTNNILEELIKPLNRKITLTYDDFPIKYRGNIMD